MNKDQKTLKRIYASLYEMLTDILHDNDPVLGLGVIGLEIPEDEFASEAAMIIARLDEAHSLSELAAIVQSVFISQFDEVGAGPITRYETAAIELWQACERYGIR